MVYQAMFRINKNILRNFGVKLKKLTYKQNNLKICRLHQWVTFEKQLDKQ